MAFFSINQLPKVNNGVYLVNLDDKKSKGTNRISIFIFRNTVADFDSFGVEHIPQEVLKKTKHKSIIHNIFRMQDNNFNVCGFYYIAFVEYMLAGKALLDYINSFSLNDCKRNDKII